METSVLDTQRRRAASTLFRSLVPALAALPLCLAAGCAMDQADATVTKSQKLGGRGCTLLRPVGWSGAANQCYESRHNTTPIAMNDGDTYFTFSAPGPGLGTGEVTVICDDGWLHPDPWDVICIPDQGGGEPF